VNPAQRFYKHFVRGACIVSTARTAELVKLAGTNIAFAIEFGFALLEDIENDAPDGGSGGVD
jgi:UDP-N-acetyl-D-mannosaminuronate dehydrogenase